MNPECRRSVLESDAFRTEREEEWRGENLRVVILTCSYECYLRFEEIRVARLDGADDR